MYTDWSKASTKFTSRVLWETLKFTKCFKVKFFDKFSAYIFLTSILNVMKECQFNLEGPPKSPEFFETLETQNFKK